MASDAEDDQLPRAINLHTESNGYYVQYCHKVKDAYENKMILFLSKKSLMKYLQDYLPDV